MSETELAYKVVLNSEEQYSVWPAERANPAGWFDEGTRGTLPECLEHIDETWTDMRPRSVRERLAAATPAD
ncbi:MbtH family protein [Streptomyces sp. NPDC050485]|uniref:MbtH family protein n=1 Tax=Streptomyces sp. NPDC050485 TaxID=3365617 RepID=UPI00379AF67C